MKPKLKEKRVQKEAEVNTSPLDEGGKDNLGSAADGSTSEVESVASNGKNATVRAQFKYVVKTSRSGKQGRKYIQVGKTLSDAPVVLRKPVKKLPAKTVRESKSTKLRVPASVSSAKILPGNAGRRGKRGTRLADELAQSNSDTE